MRVTVAAYLSLGNRNVPKHFSRAARDSTDLPQRDERLSWPVDWHQAECCRSTTVEQPSSSSETNWH